MIIHNLKVTENRTIERLDHRPIVAKTKGDDQICFQFDSVSDWDANGTLVCYMFNGTPYGSAVIDKDTSGNPLAITLVDGIYRLTVDVPYQCITSEGYLYTGLSLFAHTEVASEGGTDIPTIVAKTSTALLSQPIQILKNGGLDEIDVAASPANDMLVRMKLFMERVDNEWFGAVDDKFEEQDAWNENVETRMAEVNNIVEDHETRITETEEKVAIIEEQVTGTEEKLTEIEEKGYPRVLHYLMTGSTSLYLSHEDSGIGIDGILRLVLPEGASDESEVVYEDDFLIFKRSISTSRIHGIHCKKDGLLIVETAVELAYLRDEGKLPETNYLFNLELSREGSSTDPIRSWGPLSDIPSYLQKKERRLCYCQAGAKIDLKQDEYVQFPMEIYYSIDSDEAKTRHEIGISCDLYFIPAEITR